MRILEYKQELFGQGYTVLASKKHYECTMGKGCLPIKMTEIINGKPVPHAEGLIEAVERDWSKEGELGSWFLANYADVMRGKYPAWQLSIFRVMVGRIGLSYYNIDTGETGYVYLSAALMEYLNVEFEVPKLDGSSVMKYHISFLPAFGCPYERTTVTEYSFGGVKREIQFFFQDLHHTNPFSDKQYIMVTEYADL